MELELEAEAFEYFGELDQEAGSGGAKTHSQAEEEVNQLGAGWRKWVQRTLAAATGMKLGDDGKFGAGTIAALMAFQTANRLPVSGHFTTATIARLKQRSPEPSWFAERVGDAPAITLPKGDKINQNRCTVGAVHIPRINGVISTNAINGLRFEYVGSLNPLETAQKLKVFPLANRQVLRVQSFVGPTKRRLESFFSSLAALGLKVDSILTSGGFVQRCMTDTNRRSDHSLAEAFDLAGLRWVTPPPGHSGLLPETIVFNFANPTELKMLMRINAVLRLHFPTVLDYTYNTKHQDHFHVDNGSGKVNPHSRSSIRWLRHALEAVVGGRVVARAKPHGVFASAPGPKLYELMRRYLRKPSAFTEKQEKEYFAAIPTVFDNVTRQIAEGRF